MHGGFTGQESQRLGPTRDPLSAAQVGTQLPATAFPVLTLRGRWEDPRAEVLIAEFLCWRARLLLAVFGLPARGRHSLEKAAFRHDATQVACPAPGILRDHRRGRSAGGTGGNRAVPGAGRLKCTWPGLSLYLFDHLRGRVNRTLLLIVVLIELLVANQKRNPFALYRCFSAGRRHAVVCQWAVECQCA